MWTFIKSNSRLNISPFKFLDIVLFMMPDVEKQIGFDESVSYHWGPFLWDFCHLQRNEEIFSAYFLEFRDKSSKRRKKGQNRCLSYQGWCISQRRSLQSLVIEYKSLCTMLKKTYEFKKIIPHWLNLKLNCCATFGQIFSICSEMHLKLRRCCQINGICNL